MKWQRTAARSALLWLLFLGLYCCCRVWASVGRELAAEGGARSLHRESWLRYQSGDAATMRTLLDSDDHEAEEEEDDDISEETTTDRADEEDWEDEGPRRRDNVSDEPNTTHQGDPNARNDEEQVPCQPVGFWEKVHPRPDVRSDLQSTRFFSSGKLRLEEYHKQVDGDEVTYRIRRYDFTNRDFTHPIKGYQDMPVKLPRYYPFVAEENSMSYWDWSEYEPKFSEGGDKNSKYALLGPVGAGSYGDVFRCVTPDGRPCVMKVLNHNVTRKVRRELRVMDAVAGGPNVIELYELTRDVVTGRPTLIFESMESLDFMRYFPSLTLLEIRHYMFQLLTSIDFAHSRGVIHRDLKPHNVLIAPSLLKLRVIDWGLSDFYRPFERENTHVGSRYYKAPELLARYVYYGYAVDIWACGCIFGEMLFQRHPLFEGDSSPDQLFQIAKFFGTKAFWAFMDEYKLRDRLSPRYAKPFEGVRMPARSFRRYVNKANKHNAENPEALSLLRGLLRLDPDKRLTAAEALQHKFFDPVRDPDWIEKNKHDMMWNQKRVAPDDVY